MKAAIINGPGKLMVIDKQVPSPGPAEVLVKVEYCGICGSDIHAFESGFFPPDVVIGHEFSGLVAGVGPGCEGLAIGDKVVANNNTPCGTCHYCLKGSNNLCPEMRRLGIAEHGALAEYVIVPINSVYTLSHEVPLADAALAEPLSVALHAIRRSDYCPEKKVVIIGAGTIGLLLTALLKDLGANKILVAEPLANRAAAAIQLGATAVINPLVENLSAGVDEFFGYTGPDLVFECAGLPETINDSCTIVAAGGSVVILGICQKAVETNFLYLVTREVSIIPAFSKTRDDFQEAVETIATGRLNLAALISRKISMMDLQEGFTSPASSYLKILVEPGK